VPRKVIGKKDKDNSFKSVSELKKELIAMLG
jgi:hypothetical protein